MSKEKNQRAQEEEALEQEVSSMEETHNGPVDRTTEDSTTNDQEAQLQEMREKYLRLYAEFDNYKKRQLKEKIEMSKMAGQEVITALLPVLDDFDRARKNALDPGNEEYFSEGVELVYTKLYNTLQQQGLKEMDTSNREFDPELHDAIADIEVQDPDQKGKIIDFIEKGYFLNDRIIRYAKVIVGKR